MRFVETPVFTRGVTSVLDEEHYRYLQLALVLRPEQGAIIWGTVAGLESCVGRCRAEASEEGHA